MGAGEPPSSSSPFPQDGRDWARNQSFLDVLQQHVFPVVLSLQGNASIANLREVCSSWRRASEGAPFELIKAKLWGQGDLISMAQFLVRHPCVAAVDLGSIDPDVSTLSTSGTACSQGAERQQIREQQQREQQRQQPQANSSADGDSESCGKLANKQIIAQLLSAIPKSVRSSSFEGILAVPYVYLVLASRLPHLTHLSVRSPPDKWNFVRGLFPWDPALRAHLAHHMPAHLPSSSHAEQQSQERIPSYEDMLANMRQSGGEAGLSGSPSLYRAIYGVPVWERFKEAWLQEEAGIATCLRIHAHQLEHICIESPARSLCTGIVRSLMHLDCSKLTSLHLAGFGGKASSNAEYGEHEIGLDISQLSQAHSLSSLKLTACGVAPTPASVLESLTTLQCLHLSRTSIIFQDRTPQLSGLQQLGELLLDHAEWLDADGDVWGQSFGSSGGSSEDESISDEDNTSSSAPALPQTQQQLQPQQPQQQQDAFDMSSLLNNLQPQPTGPVLLLPSSLCVLNVTEFQGPAHINLAPLEHLSSLSFTFGSMHASLQHWKQHHVPHLDGWQQGQEDAKESTFTHHPFARLHHLSMDKPALRELGGKQGLFDRPCEQLTKLELAGVMPQLLGAHELRAVPHLTCLTFRGSTDDETDAESALGPDRGINGMVDDIAHFAPGFDTLGKLQELYLDIGCMGFAELDLRHLTCLTSLCVDSVEFVDLSRTSLPSSLKSLVFYPWYGLPELFELQEGEHNVPIAHLPQRLQRLERKAEALFLGLLSQLPDLEILKVMWDFPSFVHNFPSKSSPILLPHVRLERVRELRIRWKKELQARDFADIRLLTPNVERVCISSGTRKRLYRLARGSHAHSVLCKTCGGSGSLLQI